MSLALFDIAEYSKRAVPTKPFNTNYIVNVGADHFVAINGEQVVKIEVSKEFIYDGLEHSWQVTFYLSNGETHVIPPSAWTTNFVRETFGSGT